MRGGKKRTSNLPAVQNNYAVRGQQMEVAYSVPSRHPTGDGPWKIEADKIAWTDPVTGLGCIIRREPQGHLAGYCGVEAGHPLYGYEWSAIPADLDIDVHGGISYSAACDRSGPEATSVCHTPIGGSHGPGAEIWWFGFECDQVTDLVPSLMKNDARDSRLADGVRREYRDEAYVYGQVTDLAGQLHAIANEIPKPPRTSPSPPPIGLDPDRGRADR